MLYAIKPNSTARLSPSRSGERAICEICGKEVIAKCGRIITHHWAHSSVSDCDEWYEMSQWHQKLQYILKFNGAELETVIEKNGKKHRADAMFKNRIVIELQRSSITPTDIEAREKFYNKMVWVFDASAAYSSTRLFIRDKGNFQTFHWTHPRKSIKFVTKPLFLYLGDGRMLEIKKTYPDSAFAGWGYTTTWGEFILKIKNKNTI